MVKLSRPQSTGDNGVTIECQNVKMDSFVKILARKTELPVVNRRDWQAVLTSHLLGTRLEQAGGRRNNRRDIDVHRVMSEN
jgi:hypothetical protein